MIVSDTTLMSAIFKMPVKSLTKELVLVKDISIAAHSQVTCIQFPILYFYQLFFTTLFLNLYLSIYSSVLMIIGAYF